MKDRMKREGRPLLITLATWLAAVLVFQPFLLAALDSPLFSDYWQVSPWLWQVSPWAGIVGVGLASYPFQVP